MIKLRNKCWFDRM